MVKYCPKCGTPNPDDAMFCQRCGFPLSQAAQQPAPQQTYTPSPQTPQYPTYQYPPQYYQYYQPKTASDYAKTFSTVGAIIFSIVLFLAGITDILIDVSFYSSGEPSSVVAAIALYSVTSAMLFLIGVIVLLIGITKNITRWTLLGGIFVFIYFLMAGISDIVTGFGFQSLVSSAAGNNFSGFGGQAVPGLGSIIANGAMLIVAGVFALIAALMARSPALGRKMLAIVMGIISFFIVYGEIGYLNIINYLLSIVSEISSIIPISSSGLSAIPSLGSISDFLIGADFFNSNPDYLAVAFIIAALSVIVLLFNDKLRKYIEPFLGLAFIIFSIGVLYIGIEGISGGIPSTSGLPTTFKAAIYISVTGTILDIVAGGLLIVAAIFTLLKYLNNLSQK